MKPLKYIALTDPLYDYVTAHRSIGNDPLLNELRAETEALGEVSEMLINREQGSFLTMLVKLLNVRNAVEVGTFTGYSSICIARGLAEGGKLTCFDVSEDWTQIARGFWEKAGVDGSIQLQLGDAATLVPNLVSADPLDFVFIDADKTGYDFYYEALLPKMRPGGLFIFDNMLRGGKVLQIPLEDASDAAIDRLNKKLATDPRVESVLLPLADGLHLCRKL